MFRYLKHLYKIHDLLPQAWHHRFTFVVMNFEIYIVAQLCVTRWWSCVLSTLYWVYSVLPLAMCAVFVVETWIILPTKSLLKLLCLLLTPGKSYQSCRHCQNTQCSIVQTLNAWQVGVTFNKNLGFVQRSFKSILCDIWTSSKLEVSVVTATCGFLWDLHVGKLTTSLVALAQRLFLFWLNIN